VYATKDYTSCVSRRTHNAAIAQRFVKRTWGARWHLDTPYPSILMMSWRLQRCNGLPPTSARKPCTKDCGENHHLMARQGGSTKKCGVHNTENGLCAPLPHLRSTALGCRVMHVGPFYASGCGRATPTPIPYLPPDSPADRPGISRHQSRTLADTHHNSRAVRGHKSPTQSIHDQSPRRPARGGWHVPPLGTAVWRCLTLPHGRDHLGRSGQRRHALKLVRAGYPAAPPPVAPTPIRERKVSKAGAGSALVIPSASISAPGV